MPFRFLEDIAIADVAFKAEGRTLTELLESAALAVGSTMVKDIDKLEHRHARRFEVDAGSIEMLLFHFLQELVYLKDAELLLFNNFLLEIEDRAGSWHLIAEAGGDKIDPGRHELLADVKAVSLHNYHVRKTPQGWQADVILDV